MATLYSVVKTLEAIGMAQPGVHQTGQGHLYDDLNANPTNKYAVFYLTQTTHRSTERFDIWGFNAFYVDRLTDDMDNELQIQSIGRETLNNIFSVFCDNYNAEIVGEVKYQVFTERFADLTAGVWATYQIMMPKDIICSEVYEISGEGDGN